jgi:transcriptional regulator with XRE-family HTH domain
VVASQFSELLRRFRRQAGMTQEELEKRSGVSERTIRRLETGKRVNPQLETVRLLADALGLDPESRARLLAAAGGHTDDEMSSVQTGSATERRLAEAADDLAQAVAARWRREEELRRIMDPFPLPVQWHPAGAELTDHPENIDRVSPGGSAEPLELAGQLDEITGIYRRIRSGRLAVLGRAGSGKTILAVRFVQDLLKSRGTGAVPVVFSLGSWNPAATALRDWLTGQLVRDYPGLAATGPDGTTLAAALVQADRILPVLDGFDEIATGLHRAALEALNATPLPLVLTSRPTEYAAAVAGTDVLTAAAVVELTDLTVADLANYLPRTTRRTAWTPVLTHLHAQPDGPLAAVLRTPLMVGLARAVYSDTPGRDPVALLDTARFGTAEAIEDHLLGSFIPSVYRHQPGSRRWDPDRAQRWLSYLAQHLHRLGTRDLAWWQLGSTLRRWPRMVVVGLVAGVVFGFPAGFLALLIGWLGSGLVIGFVDMLRIGVMEGFAAGLAIGLLHGVAQVVGGAAFTPSRVRIRLRGGKRRSARFVRRLLVGLALGLALAAGLGIAGTLGIEFWILGRLGPGAGYGVLFGVLIGPLVGLVWGIMARLEAPIDIRTAVSPADLLNTNRANVVFQSSVLGVVCAAGFGIFAGFLHGPRYGLVNGLSYGLVLGFGVWLAMTLSLTAWGQWLALARIWLPLHGRLPWALIAFLDDACRRGVLRRAGAVYQFRHARLQDQLTAEVR